jgi:methionyl-tRNA formyltransferase
MNIVFFGTPDFVIPICESILNLKGGWLLCVVTNPDQPVGRKQILTPTPVKVWAEEHQIPIYTPSSLSNFQIPASNFDLGILAAYGKIIPQSIIDLFPKGILVIHPSLLPKYRGASPIQTAIMNGDQETGISIIKMDNQVDHGPIVYQSKSKIVDQDTTETLEKRLFQETADKLPLIIENYLSGKIIPITQDESQVTKTHILEKEDGYLEWKTIEKAMKTDGIVVERKIRAMSPWPGVWTNIQLNTENSKLNTKRLIIIKAHLKVLSVKSSVLCLDEIQLEGKNPISWQEFESQHSQLS